MAHEFTTQRMVEFAETDMAGILHFSNYFRYMESAEHAFFRSLGLRVHSHSDPGVWGWARVHSECTHSQPLRNEDIVELHLVVREKRRKSIRYEVVFRRVDPGGGAPVEVARGAMTTVCVGRTDGGEGMRGMAIPGDVDGKIEAAPAELLA
jgi:YbgC/YbaW family acyl-CoA thioester hydrolase